MAFALYHEEHRKKTPLLFFSKRGPISVLLRRNTLAKLVSEFVVLEKMFDGLSRFVGTVKTATVDGWAHTDLRKRIESLHSGTLLVDVPRMKQIRPPELPFVQDTAAESR